MAEQRETSEIYVELDVGNLCVTNLIALKSTPESENGLKSVAALGVQQLLNAIFKLPSEYHEHVPVAKLPDPTTAVPRGKPVPKVRPMTKWEKFAQTKGISKKPKEKLKWDDSSKGWKPGYGYRGINNNKDWLVEVPGNGDPNVDYFGKKKIEKKEKVAKNEYQRLRNIAAGAKMKVTNLESVDMANKQQLSRSLSAAKTSTASLGRFTNRLPKEKPPKNSMKKRQFKPNIGNMKEERSNNLKILETMGNKNPKLNVQEAVQRYVTKPLKEGDSKNKAQSGDKKRKSNKNKFIKTLFRGGKKNKKVFKKP